MLLNLPKYIFLQLPSQNILQFQTLLKNNRDE
jgi:hypothetical protein